MLRVQGSLTASALPSWLGANTDKNSIHLDLTGASFVEPGGFVAVAAISDWAVRTGRQVVITRPEDFSVKNYCSRMRLGTHFDSLQIDHELPTVNATPHPDDLLELSSFATEFDGEGLAQLVFDKVASGATDPQIPEALHTAICELAGNVTTHARVTHGYAAAQTYMRGTPNESIVFAVADGGIGVEASLKAAHNPRDAAHALELAVQYGITGTGEAGRGSGLHDVMQNVVGLQGEFFVLSGNARLRVKDKLVIHATTVPCVFPGTLIEGRLRCRP